MAKTMDSKVASKEVQAITPKTPKFKHLSIKQKHRVMKLYATGMYTMKELGKMMGISHSTVSYCISNNRDVFDSYKKKQIIKLEEQLTTVGGKALKQAIKKVNKLSPYQSFMVGAIAYDKLAPKQAIQIGDNRSITVTYPNWYSSRRKKKA